MFVTTWDDNIYRSVNNGTDWSNIVIDAVNPTQSESICSDSTGQYLVVGRIAQVNRRSSDYATNWSEITSALLDITHLSQSYDGSNVFAISGTSIYTSSDYGDHFTLRDNSNSYGSIAMSSTGEYGIATSGSKIYVSSDYGMNWIEKADFGSGSSACACSYSGDIMFADSSTGMMWSKDYGEHWEVAFSLGGIDYLDCSQDGTRLFMSRLYGYIYTAELING